MKFFQEKGKGGNKKPTMRKLREAKGLPPKHERWPKESLSPWMIKMEQPRERAVLRK